MSRVKTHLKSIDNAGAINNNIFNEQTSIIWLVNAFDHLLGAIVLNLFSAEDHGFVSGQAQRGGYGKRTIRNTANDIVIDLILDNVLGNQLTGLMLK